MMGTEERPPMSQQNAPRPGRESERQPRSRSEFVRRLFVAVPAIAVGLFLIITGGVVFTVGVGILGLIGLHELFRMYDPYRPVTLAGYVGLVGIIAAAHFGSEQQVLLALAATLPVIFLVGILMPERDKAPLTHGIAITFLGAAWVGLGLAFAILLRELPHGAAIIINVLVGTFIGDTAAYLGGKAFGRHKLAPRISPNKTIEGVVIGMVVAVFAVWCAKLYEDWFGHGEALLLGVAVAVMAPLGDLFESKIKRDAGVKDTGKLFGAHGGVLDRLDAALFTIPAGYYIWLLFV